MRKQRTVLLIVLLLQMLSVNTAAKVSVTVNPYFASDFYPPGWLPLRVEINNEQEQPFFGTLELIVEDHNKLRGKPKFTHYHFEVELARLTKKKFTTVIYNQNSTIKLNLTENHSDNESIFSARYQYPTTLQNLMQERVLIISDMLNILDNIEPKYQPYYSTPKDLPDHWLAYLNFNAIVLDNVRHSSINQAQLDALHKVAPSGILDSQSRFTQEFVELNTSTMIHFEEAIDFLAEDMLASMLFNTPHGIVIVGVVLLTYGGGILFIYRLVEKEKSVFLLLCLVLLFTTAFSTGLYLVLGKKLARDNRFLLNVGIVQKKPQSSTGYVEHYLTCVGGGNKDINLIFPRNVGNFTNLSSTAKGEFPDRIDLFLSEEEITVQMKAKGNWTVSGFRGATTLELPITIRDIAIHSETISFYLENQSDYRIEKALLYFDGLWYQLDINSGKLFFSKNTATQINLQRALEGALLPSVGRRLTREKAQQSLIDRILVNLALLRGELVTVDNEPLLLLAFQGPGLVNEIKSNVSLTYQFLGF